MTRGFTDTRDAADVPIDDPMYIPARQYGGEEEMGGTILYLASRAGAYCNGLVLVSVAFRPNCDIVWLILRPVLLHSLSPFSFPTSELSIFLYTS